MNRRYILFLSRDRWLEARRRPDFSVAGVATVLLQFYTVLRLEFNLRCSVFCISLELRKNFLCVNYVCGIFLSDLAMLRYIAAALYWPSFRPQILAPATEL